MSQLPALRARLEELRPRVEKLQQKIGDVDWDSKREERRRYIESRVRKVVGNRSGEEMKGMRMGVEEVRDLEAVGRGMGAGDRMEE